MITSTKHIDLDLDTPPPGLGKGLIEMTADQESQLMRSMPTFEAARPGMMVPRSEWKDRSQRLLKQYRDDVTLIYDQGSNGSCVGFASAQMLEVMLRRRYGKRHWVSLSGMSSYKRIGRSSGSGAMVSDGMDTVIEGILPADSPENKAKYKHTHNFRDFSVPLPSGWMETAQLFRGENFVVARGIDEIASALINGYCGIVGRNGHCVPFVFLDFSGEKPVCAYANSWRPTWGDEGFGYDSESLTRNMTCWILLDVATRPDLDIPSAD
jgi:hypothetical protein